MASIEIINDSEFISEILKRHALPGVLKLGKIVYSLFRGSGKVKYKGASIGIVIRYNSILPIPPFGNARLIGLSSSAVSSSVLTSNG